MKHLLYILRFCTIPALGFGFCLFGTNLQAEQPFQYSVKNNEVEITGYTGRSADIVIPGEIEGMPVTRIGENAFRYREFLTSVSIPDTVREIGSQAFIGNKKLSSVRLPKKLELIDASAFSDCTALEAIELPEGLQELNTYAFRNCERLKIILIPANVREIPGRLFMGCTALESITTAPSNELFVSEDGVLFNKDRTEIIECPEGRRGSFTISAKVIKIRPGALRLLDYIDVADANPIFSSSGGVLLSKDGTVLVQYPGGIKGPARIPESVTAIAAQGFQDSTGLTSADLPERILKIDPRAFYGCSNLLSVTLPAKLQKIDDGMFWNCWRLVTVSIPDTVTEIAPYAFDGCSKLARLKLPKGLSKIAFGTFELCITLTGIEIPEGVTVIEHDAFWCCQDLARVTIPASVNKIDKNAFSKCSSLKTINLPRKDIEIGENAFPVGVKIIYTSAENGMGANQQQSAAASSPPVATMPPPAVPPTPKVSATPSTAIVTKATDDQTLSLTKEVTVPLKYGETKLQPGTKIKVVRFDNNFAVANVMGQEVRIDRSMLAETNEAEKKVLPEVAAQVKPTPTPVVVPTPVEQVKPAAVANTEVSQYAKFTTSVTIRLLTKHGLLIQADKKHARGGKLPEGYWEIPAGTELEVVKDINLKGSTIEKSLVQYTKDGVTEQFWAQPTWFQKDREREGGGSSLPNCVKRWVEKPIGPGQTHLDVADTFCTELAEDGKTYVEIDKAPMALAPPNSHFYLGDGTESHLHIGVAYHPDYIKDGNLLFYDKVEPLVQPANNLTEVPVFKQTMKFAVVPKPKPFTRKAAEQLEDKIRETGIEKSGYPIVEIPVLLRQRTCEPPDSPWSASLWIESKEPLIERSKPVQARTVNFIDTLPDGREYTKVEPNGHTFTIQTDAALMLWFQRTEDYELVREWLLSFAKRGDFTTDTTYPQIPYRVIDTCCLAPLKNAAQGEEIQKIINRAKEIEASSRDAQHSNEEEYRTIEAIAAYRTGNYRGTIALLEPLPLHEDHRRLFFLSMAYAKLGHLETAKRIFEKALKKAPSIPPQENPVLKATSPFQTLAHLEARALLVSYGLELTPARRF